MESIELLADDEVIFVLTCERAEEDILACGGSQFWRTSRKEVKKRKYLIATRNRNHELSEKTEQHHEGFLVGRISGIGRPFGTECSRLDRATEEEHKDRWIIEIDKYAFVRWPECWNFAGRNPIRYKKISQTNIDPCCLEFCKVPPRDYYKIRASACRRKGHP